MKNFCTSKDIIKKVERQPASWKKILANHVRDKGVVPRIHEEHSQLNRKMTNNPAVKMNNGLEWICPQTKAYR